MDAEQYIEQRFGGRRSGDELITDCIWCGKDRHLYINIEKGLAHCFSCGKGANLVQLVQAIEGVSWAKALMRVGLLTRGVAKRRVEDLANLRKLLANAHEAIERAPITLPEGARPMLVNGKVSDNAKSAYYYLRERGIRIAQWQPYAPLYVTKRTRYFGHIVFPNYDECGDADFFVTRSTALRRSTRSVVAAAKSYTPTGAKRAGVLFGAWRVPSDYTLAFVVEGPLDMLALSQRAVASLGRVINEDMASLLARRFREVVLVPDADVPTDIAISNAVRCARAGLRVRTVSLREGDPADIAQAHGDDPHFLRTLHVRLLHDAAPFRMTKLLRDRLRNL